MVIWDINRNFWEVNPLFELHFKDIKDEDPTQDKEWSSMRMWCIAFMGDIGSPNRNMSKDEQLMMIRESYLKERKLEIERVLEQLDKNLPKVKKSNKEDKTNKETKSDKELKEQAEQDAIFNYDLDQPYIKRMIDVTYPKAKKILRKWEDKLEEWQEFIDKTKVNEDTYEMLGKMMTQSHSHWKQYYIIKKEADSESEEKVMGGQEESFLEMEIG